MNKMNLRFAHVLAAAMVVLFAVPAFAGTMYYGELLTSDQSLLFPGDMRATMEAGYIGDDPMDLYLNGDIYQGQGLGDGYLSGRRDYVVYTHSFTPSMSVLSVTSAHLYVGIRDDQFFDGKEKVSLALNDEFWQRGSAWFSLFEGDVTAFFHNAGDELQVAVVSRKGDSVVDFSFAKWEYETDGGPSAGGAQPVPEPTGLALFCVGAVVLRRAARSRA